LLLICIGFMTAARPESAAQQQPLTEEEAFQLGVEAYLRFFGGYLHDWSCCFFLRFLAMLVLITGCCRASIGRSSVLAVAILARLGWETNEAFDAVGSARGCSIPDTPEQRQWVTQNVPAAH
jgi:hypothetical protein